MTGVQTCALPISRAQDADRQIDDLDHQLLSAAVLFSLLIFRLLYYLVPFMLALAVLGIREFRLHFFERRNVSDR